MMNKYVLKIGPNSTLRGPTSLNPVVILQFPKPSLFGSWLMMVFWLPEPTYVRPSLLSELPRSPSGWVELPSCNLLVHRKVKPIVLTKEPVREFPGLQRVVPLSMLLELCRPLVLGIFLITPRTQYLQKLVSGCAMGL